LKRLVSALCILPPVALIVHFGSSFHFLLLLTFIIGLGLLEFYRMLSAKGFPCWRWLGTLCGMGMPLAFYMGGMANQGAVAGTVILMFIAALVSRQELTTSVQSVAFTLLGVFYVGWLLSYVLLLHGLMGGPNYVFFIFSVIWLGDATALVVGTLVGRYWLAPSISPHKTVEGAIGGLIGSLIGAVFGGFWLLGHYTVTQYLIIGGILAILGQMGDLCESLLKRSTGIKDSGILIPGHGGILDKVDGILFGAPALYYYILYVMREHLSS
jgi:phosphatidate cytidylyltransferase